LGKKFSQDIAKVIKYCKEASPWHGWFIYGSKGGKEWMSAEELCTRRVALGLSDRARFSYNVAKRFIKIVE